MSAARRWLAVLAVAGVLASTAASAPVPVAHAADTLTASFAGVPSAHDGVSPFSFDLVFSEAVSISYATLRDDSFDVTGATVTGARRIGGRSDLWQITVAPDVATVTDAVADISIELPATSDCGDEGAVCTAGDAKALSNTASATVTAPPPLVAAFEGVPATHDSSTEFSFRLRFSTAVTTSYRILGDTAFDVTGGEVSDARRIDGRSDLWQITIQPDTVDDDTVDDDITITLPATEDCADADAVCTVALRPLSEPVTAAVEGPLVEAEQNSERGQRVTRGVPGDADEEDRVGVRDAPGQPGRALTQGRDMKLTFSWSEISDTGGSAIVSYDVQYKLTSSSAWLDWTRTSGATDRSETITGLTNWVLYDVRVRGVNADGDIGEWITVTRRTTAPTLELTSNNGDPRGIVGNADTVWVADRDDFRLYAYTKDPWAYNSSLDIRVDSLDGRAVGVCLGDGHFWLPDDRDNKVHAYDATARTHTSSRDFDLHSDNARPRGAACHGTTIWVADQTDRKLYAYSTTTGARIADSDISYDGVISSAGGVWTDGTLMWILDSADVVRAYTLGGVHKSDLDFNITVASNFHAAGLWVDETNMNMLVTEGTVGLMYQFPIPIAASGVPTSVASVGGSDGSVTVTWGVPDSDGGTAIMSYDVRYKKSVDDDVVASWSTETQSDPSTRSLTISGLDLGVAYDVQVRADNGTDGEWSASASAETGRDFALDTTRPYDLTSDDTTVWVTDGTTRTVKAYSLSNGARDDTKDFTTDAANDNPTGICWTNDSFWVAQSGGTTVYSYATNGARQASRDFILPTDTEPRGLYCGRTALYVVDDTTDTILNYSRGSSTNPWERVLLGDVDPSSASGRDDSIGVWFDAATAGESEIFNSVPVFVSGAGVDDDQVFAHGTFSVERFRDMEFDLVSANGEPAGIWSDGTTMWVLDRDSQVAYGYRLPLGTDDGPDPRIAEVATDGLSVLVTFSESLDRTVTPAASAFEVTAGSDTFTPTTVVHTVDDGIVVGGVTLSFTSALPAGATMTIAYTAPPSTDPAIQDAGGVAAASFTGFKMANRPTVPQNVAAAPGDGSLTVSWEAPSANGGLPITGYRVRHRLSTAADEDASYTTVTRSDAAATSETISGLTNGTGYTVQVNATNTAGTSAWASVTGTPAAPAAPSVPQSLSFVSRNESLVLDWDEPNSNGGTAITAYEIGYRVAGTTGAYMPVTRTSAALETSETVTGLTNYTVYEVQVAARNSVGLSDYATIDRAMPSVNHEAVLGAGLWSDGTTYWVLRSSRGEAGAYTLATGERQTAKDADFRDVNSEQSAAEGICSDGTTTWVSGDSLNKIYAYEHALDDGTLAYTSGKDIDTGSGSFPTGLWCDEDTLLAVSNNGHEVRVYDLPSGVRDSARDIDGLTDANGVWSDGVTIWVREGNTASTAINAYSALDGARREWLDIKNLDAAAATNLRGIWSDGTHMWVVHIIPHRVFKFPVPSYGDGPPVPRSAEVSADGTTVKVTFTEALAASTVTAAARFEVRVGSVTVTPDSVALSSGDATSVTLTLAAAAGEGVAVTVAYSDPDNNQITGVVQDAGGADAPSFTKLSATPRAVTAPGAPTALMADPGDASLAVSWSEPATGGTPDTYAVRHRLTSDADEDASYTTVTRSDAAATSETISGLTNGTGYTVQVNATNTVGTSTWASVTGTPVAPTAPSEPKSLSFASRNESLVLDWDEPNSNGGTAITAYEIGYRVAGTTGAYMPVTRTSAALETSETVTGLTNYTVYEVQIAARNSVGLSDYAEIAEAMPTPNFAAGPASGGPEGLWSDGTTAWVGSSLGAARAYVLATGQRDSGQDVNFKAENSNQVAAQGICSDGTTTWVSADWRHRIYAYENALDDETLSYVSGKDIDTGSDSYPAGLWCDGETLLVVANEGSAVWGYDLPSRARNSARDFTGEFGNGNGVWSDRITVWVADNTVDMAAIQAYSALDGARRDWLDIENVRAAGLTPKGIWSDGTHMWAVNTRPDRVFKLPLPQYGDGPPVPRSAEVSVDGMTVKVTFTEALATDVTPAVARFEVTVGSDTVMLSSVAHTSGDDTSVTLTLPDAAGEGVAVTVAYDDPDDDQTDNVVQDAGGADAPSFTKLSATPRAVTAPGAPTALMADPGDASLTVSWTVPATGGTPDTYAVRHRLTSAADADASYTTVTRSDAAATSETISGLTNGTGYTVQVNATNTAGTSTWASVTGTPVAPAAPSEPKSLSFASRNESLELDWATPNSNGGAAITAYEIGYRVAGTTDAYTPVARTSAALKTSETVTGLTNYTVYEVQIAARNSVGLSDYAGIDEAMPTPNFAADPALGDPVGLWSDEMTAWVGSTKGAARAYVLETGQRDSDKDVNFKAENSNQVVAQGICSDGTTTWVSADWGHRIYAYEHALDDETLSYNSGKDINPGSGSYPAGLWCDGETLLVVADEGLAVWGYDLPGGTRNSARDITGEFEGGSGVWSDRITVWVTDETSDIASIQAYSALDGARRDWLDIENVPAAGLVRPKGIWSDGTHMWTVNLRPHRVFKFPVPAYGDGPPVPRSAEVSADGTTVKVTFTEALATGVTPAVARFEVTVGSDTVMLSSVAHTSGDDTSVTLTLPDAAGEGVAVTVAYDDPDDDQTDNVVQDAGGADAPSFTKLSATPRAVTAPGAPTALMADPGDASLTVSWTVPATSGTPDTYAVRYRLTSADADMDSSYTTVDRSDAELLAETISGLTNGTGYTVQVNATNTAGTSTWASVTGTPAAPAAPSVPLSLSFASRNESLVLDWDAPSPNGGVAVTNYVVQYRVEDTMDWTTWTRTSDALDTGETITGLTNYTVYEVQVAARNGDTDAAIGDYATIPEAMPALSWTTTDDASNPHGLWSDGTTAWVVNVTRVVVGYALSDFSRVPGEDFNTFSLNTNQINVWGICSDGTTTWVLSPTRDVAYGYERSGGSWSYVNSKDIDLGTDDFRGLWCNTELMLVSVGGEDTDAALRAWDLPSRERNTSRDIDTQLGRAALSGLWSDGLTVWFVDSSGSLTAMSMLDGARRPWLDIGTLAAAGNDGPRGIWANDMHMWVVDGGDDRVYRYPLPQYGDGPPVPRSAEVSADGTTVKVTFTEALATDVTPAVARFEVTVGSDTVMLDSVAHTSGDDTSVTLTLPDAAGEGVAVTVAYDDPDDDQTDNVVQDAGGADAPSFTKLSATPRAVTAPGAPTALMADPGDASLTVSWTVPATGGTPDTYAVRHRLTSAADADASYTTVDRSDAELLAETISGLTNGTGYTVQVNATNTAGTSAWASVTGTPAAAPSTTTEVPKNWTLIPTGLNVGDQFRLLFVTSTTRDASTASLSVYDTHVQNAVNNGHFDIKPYRSQFEVLGSSTEADARDHTDTTDTDTGVPIYYLGGAKVANDYEDFYDGSWRSHSPTNEAGDDSNADQVWTGSDGDGTVSDRGFGNNSPDSTTLGDPTSSTTNHVLNHSSSAQSGSYPLYGLSPVFEVSSTAVAAEVASVAVTSAPEAASDTYGVGEVIQFTVTFYHPVEVSTNRPHFEFSLNGDREAAYQSGSGTTALTFAYTVLAADTDDNGIWIGDQSRTIKFDSGEYIHTVGGDDLDAILTHSAPGTQSDHKVNGSLTPTIDAVPDAPTGVTVGAGNKSLVVGWSAVTATPVVTGYKIQYRVTGTEAWTEWTGTIAATATSETVTGLSEWVSYDVQVRATNSEGDGAWSDIATGTAHRDVTLSAAGSVDGVGSDGTTLWATVPGSNIASAYQLSDGTADTAKNVTFASGTAPTGICAHGTRVWVAQSGSLSLQAYDTDGTRQSSKDVALPTGTNPVAVFCNEFYLFVAHDDTGGSGDAVLSYFTDLEGSYFSDMNFGVEELAAAGNANPAGLFLHGEILWVSDSVDNKAYAYSSGTGRRLADMDLDLGSAVGTAAGIWGDAATLWAADADAAATEIDSSRRPLADAGAPDVWHAFMENDSSTKMRVLFSEVLDGTSTPPASAFTVMAGTDPVAVASVVHLDTGGGTILKTLVLTLGSVPVGTTVTVSYTVPAANPVQDLDGDDAPSFSGLRVWSLPGGLPGGVSVVPGDGELEVSWDAAAHTGRRPAGTSYQVQYKLSTATGWTTLARSNDDRFVVGQTITGRTNGSQHDVRVRAENAVGDGPYSVVVRATPSAGPLVTVEAGSADSTFKATDNKSGSTTWHYAWIAGTAVCDSTATFPSASNYNEGADLAYTSTQNTNKACFRSTEGTNSGYAASEVVNTNSVPVFDDATLTREVTENSAANVNVGAVIPAATDADAGAVLVYSMEGTDAASFNFNVTTRQISTKAGVTYDYEDKTSYEVTIKVTDGTDSNTVVVTINVEDLPTISIEAVQERVLLSDGLFTFDVKADSRPSVDLSIPSVEAQDHAWVAELTDSERLIDFFSDDYAPDPEAGQVTKTYTIVGGAPVESGDFTVTLHSGAGYELDAATSSATVEIVAADPLITVRAEQADYSVAENFGTLTVTLIAQTVAGAPKPREPLQVSWAAVAGTATGGGADFGDAGGIAALGVFGESEFTEEGVRWVATMDVEVTVVDDSTWELDETFHIALSRHSDTHPLIKLANADGTLCEDNASGVNCGATVTILRNDNAAPVFSNSSEIREVAENSPADTDVGAPVTATDADTGAGDALTYSLEGADAASFAVHASTGQITTVAGVDYDFEADPSYSVTVKATDLQSASVTVAVTINLIDFEQVDNDTPDTTAPLLESNTVSGSTLTLTYNEALDEGSVPAPGAFVVNVAPTGGTAQPRDVTVVVDGVIVRLTLVSPVAPGDTVTLVYTVPGSNPVQDQSGNDAAAIDITIELLLDQTGVCNRAIQDSGRCDLSTATTLTPDVPLPAAVGERNDVDWFRVELKEGKVYRIDMEGAPTGKGTLRDPYLRGMFAVFTGSDVLGHQADGRLDGGGEDIETIWYSLHGDCAAGERSPSTDCELFDEGTYYNDDGGVGYNARLYLRDFPPGAHYVEARGLGPATGTYTITLTEVTDDAEGARTLDLSTQTSAVIDFPGDTDTFTVDLTADTEYTITLRSQGWDGWSRIDIDTAHHNSAPGIRVDTPYDGSTGTYTITPATTGTHTLRIIGRNWGRHQRFATGDYTITITG